MCFRLQVVEAVVAFWVNGIKQGCDFGKFFCNKIQQVLPCFFVLVAQDNVDHDLPCCGNANDHIAKKTCVVPDVVMG